MNLIAFVIALVAVAIFVACHLGVQRKWASLPLGLVALVAAWMVHAIVVGGYLVRID